MGQSDKPDVPYAMADYAADAAALLEQVGWGPCPVLGYSFGGMVAQELALRRPRSAWSGWCCCPPPAAAPAAHRTRCTNSPAWHRRIVPGAWWNWATRAAMPPGSRPTHRCSRPWSRKRSPPSDSAPTNRTATVGARRQLEARRGHDTWERLPRLQMPVAIFGGRYDGIAPPDRQARPGPAHSRRPVPTVRGRPPLLPAGCASLSGDPRRAARRQCGMPSVVGRAAPARCSPRRPRAAPHRLAAYVPGIR
ncbi:MAG: alpha/beta hydrolase [Comamonadaceae bacterium]|nr:alpha/beta hydrolase [Comamonadaceae bacterium]